MVESQTQVSAEDKEVVAKYLGSEGVIFDPKYKGSTVLYETQAKRRKELISEVNYTFALTLHKGEYFGGHATVQFYLEEVPANAEELFINLHAIAVSGLTINGVSITEQSAYEGQVIKLLPA